MDEQEEQLMDVDEFNTKFTGEKASVDSTIAFDEMDELDYQLFLARLGHRREWLETAISVNNSQNVMSKFIKSRRGSALRTLDMNVFGEKGLGKSYMTLKFKDNYHNFFKEDFDWSSFYMSPVQFLMFCEENDVDRVSNKFMCIDEPRVRERGEGSQTLWHRFMNTRATIRPIRTCIVMASEHPFSSNPHLVLRMVYLDEKNKCSMAIVLDPNQNFCLGSVFASLPNKKVVKEYDKIRRKYEASTRGDKSEILAYWTPFAGRLIEKYKYSELANEIIDYREQMFSWNEDKKANQKPVKPAFMNNFSEISDNRIVQDARYEKKLSSTEYKFVAQLVRDILKNDVDYKTSHPY